MEGLMRKGGEALAKVGETLGLRNVDPDAGLIFVTGGSGVIGHRVAKKLIDTGYTNVRLSAQSTEIMKDMQMKFHGADVTTDFSWCSEDTYDKALKDVKSVFCAIPYGKDWEQHFPAFLEACKKAGVRHFVKLSYYHGGHEADRFREVPLIRHHMECDQKLIQFAGTDMGSEAMSYTILYATTLMSNPFIFQASELRDGKLYGASDHKGVNYVSPNDIAEVAVCVLLEPKDHSSKEYTLTGPEAITDEKVAHLLSNYLKHEVQYVDMSPEEFCNHFKKSGDPSWMIDDMAAMEKVKASGVEESESFVTDDIEKMCNRKAETYHEYLQKTDLMTPYESEESIMKHFAKRGEKHGKELGDILSGGKHGEKDKQYEAKQHLETGEHHTAEHEEEGETSPYKPIDKLKEMTI